MPIKINELVLQIKVETSGEQRAQVHALPVEPNQGKANMQLLARDLLEMLEENTSR